MAAPVAIINDIAANNLLNRLDPPKDAMDGGFLNNGTHGAYIVARLNELFPPAMQQPGVGDTKQQMINAILAYISPNIIQNKQQLIRLKFSANGVDNRYLGLFVAHDAGPGPSQIVGNKFTLVLTPGSILDPAAKIKPKDAASDITSITQPNTFTVAELSSIAMNTAFGGAPITFTPGPASSPYIFDIPTIGQLYFNDKYQAIGPQASLFAGNPTKNAFLASAVSKDTPANRKLASQFLLAKEIGDTLQVCWLKTLLNSPLKNPAMTMENTAIMSNDKVVWLRALINRVSVFHSEGQTVTFYSADNSPEAVAAGVARMKQHTIAELKRNNDSVLEIFERILTETPDATFEGAAFIGATQKQQQFMKTIRIVRDSLVEHYKDILALITQIPDDTPYKIFKDILVRYYFCTPIIEKNHMYKFARTFKGFLPFVAANDYIGNKLLFNPQHLYAILTSGRSDAAINTFLRDIIHPRTVVMAGGARTKQLARLSSTYRRLPMYPMKPTGELTLIKRVNLTDTILSSRAMKDTQPSWISPVNWPPGFIDAQRAYISNPAHIPELPAPAPTTPINPNPYTEEEYEYITAFWNDANLAIPGFISAHILTHFPEILYLGHALYRMRNTGIYTAVGPINLFSHNETLTLTDSFTNLVGYNFTNYIAPELTAHFTLIDNYVKQLCQLSLPMIAAFIGTGVNQYQEVAAAAAVGLVPAPVFTNDELLEAWGEYQSLYFAELITTRLNIRDQIEPYRVLQYTSGLTTPELPLVGGSRKTRGQRHAAGRRRTIRKRK